MKPIDLSDYDYTDDLSRAHTIPARWYLQPDFLSWEKERVFSRTWQPVARSEDLLRGGDYVACDLLGEPLVVTRNMEGELNAFYNVCRHRAARVAQGKGNRKSLQCQYHGWTYGLDGRLRRAPEFDGVQEWDVQDVCLQRVQVAEWHPFVYVNLDPGAPELQTFLEPIIAEVRAHGFNVEKMRLAERRDYMVNCNWKVYVDNYLEGYHIPIAHPGLFREIDYDQYRVDTFTHYSKAFAPMRPASEVAVHDRDRRYLRTEAEEEALYYWVFPNLMLNFYPDNMQLNIILPLDHERTLTIFEWYFEQPGSGAGWESMQQSVAFSDQVQQEDIVLCEIVQQGLRSRSYDAGRFSVRRENGVHHFHSLLYEYLSRPQERQHLAGPCAG